METTLQQKEKSLEGRKFRFLVNDAQEAVQLIRKHLGEKARVISVDQVKGKGLKRFISSPKLAVVASVPKGATDEVPETETSEISETPTEQSIPAPVREEAVPVQPLETPVAADSAHSEEANPLNLQGSTSPINRIYGNNSETRTAIVSTPIARLLRNANFDQNLLNRFESSPDWNRISEMPLNHALGELYSILTNDFHRIESKPVTNRVAFIGTTGVGKSTALCKHLANDVFAQNKKANVLKLETEEPNPDDALRIFCDVMDIPLLRDPIDVELIDESLPLYLDLPGAPTTDRGTWQKFRKRLDALNVDTRALVINAAYDSDSIKEAYNLGLQQGATHVVFTHLDEVTNPTKLWHFLLCGGLSPLFYSFGQDITHNFSDSILEYMMDKTFPNSLFR